MTEMQTSFDFSEVDPMAEVYKPKRKPRKKPAAKVVDTNPKTKYGKAKPAISLIPAASIIHTADAFRDGAAKYGPANWRIDPVSVSTYTDAALRHLFSWIDGEEVAEDSGVHHLGHAIACLAIILDAQEQQTLVDDRPTEGKASSVLKRLTKPL